MQDGGGGGGHWVEGGWVVWLWGWGKNVGVCVCVCRHHFEIGTVCVYTNFTSGWLRTESLPGFSWDSTRRPTMWFITIFNTVIGSVFLCFVRWIIALHLRSIYLSKVPFAVQRVCVYLFRQISVDYMFATMPKTRLPTEDCRRFYRIIHYKGLGTVLE